MKLRNTFRINPENSERTRKFGIFEPNSRIADEFTI